LPFTYVSHQAPAVALKLIRPRWFDGTALVIGSMAPDFAYAFRGSRLHFSAHTPLGILWFCLPVTMLICWAIRARVAEVAFAQLPDTPLRLHDYRVLGGRRPWFVTTAISAVVGAFTHSVWDTFTHNGRWGVRHVAFLREYLFQVNDFHFTMARLLQYVSHFVGAAVTIGLLWWIAHRRLLAKWYGPAYDALGPVALTSRERLRFWSIAALGTALGVVWMLGPRSPYTADILRVSLGLAAGVAVAAFSAPRTRAPASTLSEEHR
jgi:hypothetical protein